MIDFVLGAGGFGVTYQAIDEALGRRVAIKEFFPRTLAERSVEDDCITVIPGHSQSYQRALRHFEAEGKILAQLRHPNVVQIFSLFRDKGTVYLVMELLEGQTLGEYLKQEKVLPPERVEAIVSDLVKALATLHDRGVLHLDIKPDNIILTTTNRLVLVDFGAARWEEDEQQRGLTRTVAAYTMGYAPIELVEGSRARATPATDIYEMSVMVYELLTGHRPPNAYYRLHNQWEPGDVPKEWQEMLKAGLALNPEDRPQTINQWWGLYKKPPSPIARRIPYRLVGLTVGVAVVLGLGGAFWWSYSGWWQERQALLALDKKQYQAAVAIYNQLLQRRPAWVEGWRQRGRAYLGLKQFAQALADYQRAYQLSPDRSDIRQEKFQLYLQWVDHLVQSDPQDLDQIQRLLQEAQTWHPESAGQVAGFLRDAYSRLARFRLSQGDRQGALEVYLQLWRHNQLNEAIRQEIRPHIADLYAEIGKGHLNQGKWDLAMENVEAGLRIDPEYGRLYWLRGQLWRQKKQWDSALTDYNRALESLSIADEQNQARYERALILAEKGQIEIALAEHEDLLKKGWERDFVYNSLGRLLFRQKNYTASLNSFSQALRLNPQYAPAYANRGWAKYHLADYSGAAADFENAIRLDQQNPIAFHGLGYVSAKLNQPKEKILASLEQAKKLYLEQGDPQKVLEIERWIAQNIR
ncbi:MAG: tetratricopeptide repeat protein [Thermofilaceae archaeon]